MTMTKDEAITQIMQRLAANEEAADELLRTLAEFPEVIAQHPPIALATLRLISTRLTSGRIIQECREVIDEDS